MTIHSHIHVAFMLSISCTCRRMQLNPNHYLHPQPALTHYSVVFSPFRLRTRKWRCTPYLAVMFLVSPLHLVCLWHFAPVYVCVYAWITFNQTNQFIPHLCGWCRVHASMVLCLVFITGKKRKRCGHCNGCRAEDCGTCKYCIDNPRFGGQGRKNQCCVARKCTNMKQTSPNQASEMYQWSIQLREMLAIELWV